MGDAILDQYREGRGVQALLLGAVGHDWFGVTSDSPFRTDQAERGHADPWTVLAEAFPPDIDLLRRRLPARLPRELGTQHPTKLRAVLGYGRSYKLITFIRGLPERDLSGELAAPSGYNVRGI